MRAISLHQPWATYIALGLKTIETRSWGTAYRGPIAIHAAKSRASLDAHADAKRRLARDWVSMAALRHEPSDFGSVVAVAELVDVFRVPESGLDRHVGARDLILGDLSAGRYGWVLRDVRPLREPVPLRGRQGLWVLDEATIHRVREAIQTAAPIPSERESS